MIEYLSVRGTQTYAYVSIFGSTFKYNIGADPMRKAFIFKMSLCQVISMSTYYKKHPLNTSKVYLNYLLVFSQPKYVQINYVKVVCSISINDLLRDVLTRKQVQSEMCPESLKSSSFFAFLFILLCSTLICLYNRSAVDYEMFL